MHHLLIIQIIVNTRPNDVRQSDNELLYFPALDQRLPNETLQYNHQLQQTAAKSFSSHNGTLQAGTLLA
ncbi:MAG: hypothetical protein EOM37_12720 [Proteobacteria bacterium]|nr:hypothetical protein [Pseudomonadota bacterium]